jgi:hypothetical protein
LVYVYGISSAKIDDTFSMVIAVFMVSIAFGSMAHDGASAERWANRQEEERIKYNNLSTIDKEKYDKDLAQKEEKTKERRYGEINKKVMCPHCQTRGFVRKQLGTRLIRASVRGLPEPIAAGTNTKLKVTKFRCDNCETDWSVEI